MAVLTINLSDDLKELWRAYCKKIGKNMCEPILCMIEEAVHNDITEPVDVKKSTCVICGFQWMPRKGPPATCPSCKSYHWNNPAHIKTGYSHKCMCCDVQWYSKSARPATCPSCKASKWDDTQFVLRRNAREQKKLRDEFCLIIQRIGRNKTEFRSSHEVAAVIGHGMTADKLSALLRGETPVNQAQIDLLGSII